MLEIVRYSSPSAPDLVCRSIAETGFAALDDVPIDPGLVPAIVDEWSRWFEAAGVERLPATVDGTDGYHAYEPGLVPGGRRDRKEFFHVQPGCRYPAEVSSRANVYYWQAFAVAATILDWVDAWLRATDPGRAGAGLVSVVDACSSVLRVQRYLASEDDVEGEPVIRALAHTDINLLTVLPAPAESGLQIQSRDGRWCDVVPAPGVVIVNVGEMLGLLSDGRLEATPHRVVEPPRPYGARLSLPLFVHPRPDVQVSPTYTASGFVRHRADQLRALGWAATPGNES